MNEVQVPNRVGIRIKPGTNVRSGYQGPETQLAACKCPLYNAGCSLLFYLLSSPRNADDQNFPHVSFLVEIAGVAARGEGTLLFLVFWPQISPAALAPGLALCPSPGRASPPVSLICPDGHVGLMDLALHRTDPALTLSVSRKGCWMKPPLESNL